MLDFLNEDVDRLLSYNTQQQVKVLDRFLGFTNIALSLLIVGYIVGFVFIIDKGYLEYEEANGIAVTHVSGSLMAAASSLTGGESRLRYFGAEDVNYPALENGNVFITTKMEVVPEERGICADPQVPCEEDEECFQGGSCNEDGLCVEPSWCPHSSQKGETYKLEGAGEKFHIWIKSGIQFYMLKKERLYQNNVALPVPYPEENANTFTVRQLLSMCQPPVRFEEVSELGAAVEVKFIWKCNVNGKPGSCLPSLQARRVDSLLDPENIGFRFAVPEYSGPSERMLNKVTGIRFYIRTIGTGFRIALTAIIFKISTGIALLAFAPLIADFLMLNCFKATSKYYARKYELSPDFSDHFEALAARQAQNEAVRAEAREREESEELRDVTARRVLDREDVVEGISTI